MDMEELERALTIVKKREHMKNPDDFDFLEKIDPEIGNDLRQADFKQKLEELRERHLQTQYELERAEKMLKVQMSINRDLHLELEDASSKKSVKHAELLHISEKDIAMIASAKDIFKEMEVRNCQEEVPQLEKHKMRVGKLVGGALEHRLGS